MNHADSTERAALISGFRALADYLESNPEVPAPASPTVHTFPSADDWPQMRAEIDATAARLGVTARLTGGGHYVAVRYFGPVEYQAVAIPPKNDARRASKAMSPILVLAGVGVLAVAAAVTLAVLIIGIQRGDRRHLARVPVRLQTHSRAGFSSASATPHRPRNPPEKESARTE